MATGFTPDEVRQLEEDFAKFMPREPTLADLQSAPKVKKVAFAGTERGMLLHLDTGTHGKRNLFLNPVVARTLMEGVAQGGIVHGWWSKVEKVIKLAPDLTREDLEGAIQVRSLRTANVPKGLLVFCATENSAVKFFMRPNFAAAVAWSVEDVAKKAQWWADDYALIPDRGSLN